MRSTIFFIVLTLVMLFLVGKLLRSRKIREHYAVLWILVGLLMIVLVAFPGLLNWLAQLVGVALPSNLLFILAIMMLLGVTLQLTLEISRAEDRVRVLAENVAILNLVVREADLTTKVTGEDTPDTEITASIPVIKRSKKQGRTVAPRRPQETEE